jgi:hypothetical protein
MRISPTDVSSLKRKAILTLKVSPDTKPDVTRTELADFIKELQRTLIAKRHLKHLRLVLVEVEKEKDL